jgi:hypothetical protein
LRNEQKRVRELKDIAGVLPTEIEKEHAEKQLLLKKSRTVHARKSTVESDTLIAEYEKRFSDSQNPMIDLANRLKESNACVEGMRTPLCQLKLENRELERCLAFEVERKNIFASMVRSNLLHRSHHR